MRVLITGAAGLVGGAICRRLIEQGHAVLAVDDLSSSSRGNVPPGCEFVETSILDDLAARSAESFRPTHVLHLAAWFANQNSIDFPQEDLTVNGIGTIKMLEIAERLGVERFVFSSSSCVYGGRAGLLAEDAAPGQPETPYAATKWLGEKYVEMWAQRCSMDAVVLRLFNVYGPGDAAGPYRSVIPNFISSALKDEPLRITGDGSESRSFTYVDDVAARIQQALEVDVVPTTPLNVGGRNQTRIIRLAEEVRRLTASSSEIRLEPRRAWDHTLERVPDLTRLELHLGATDETPLSQGLERTISWFRMQFAG